MSNEFPGAAFSLLVVIRLVFSAQVGYYKIAVPTFKTAIYLLQRVTEFIISRAQCSRLCVFGRHYHEYIQIHWVPLTTNDRFEENYSLQVGARCSRTFNIAVNNLDVLPNL